jgi:hypothetical protein
MKQKEGKKNKTAERLREGGWLREEVAWVVKMTVEENGPFGIKIPLRQ